MTLRAVLFDFQDTLAYYHPAHLSLYVLAAKEHGIEIAEQDFGALDQAWERWRTPLGIDHSAASKDERSFRALRVAVHRHRYRSLGVDESLADAIAERVGVLEGEPQYYQLYEDTLPALNRLAAAGVRVGIVSNHVWRLPEVVEALGLRPLVDTVITSARVGYRKPHPAIYRAALDALGCEAADVLFVGDNPVADVDGPRAAGMRALLLDRSAKVSGDGVIWSLLDIPLPDRGD